MRFISRKKSHTHPKGRGGSVSRDSNHRCADQRGDAPGMNAAVRAVARAGIYNGFR